MPSEPSFDEVAAVLKERTTRELDAMSALPREKAREAFLVYALEREQVVDVAYSEDAIADVIEMLEVDEETRDVVRRAVLWLQRDEALHAQYIRGRLLRSRRPLTWAPILATQVVGMVGGWCSAVSPNHRAEAFGLRRVAARSALTAGSLVGRLPRALAAALSAPGFEAFCRTNRLLENSAVLAYRRLLPLLDDDEQSLFSRILADELRHAEVFGVLLDHFEGNRWREGATLDSLIAGLKLISPWFVPARFRDGSATDPAVVDNRVEVASGSEVGEAVDEVLTASGIDDLVAGKRIAIRTNFMLTYDRRDRSTMVSPETLSAVVGRLREAGAVDIVVIDAPNIYDRYFANRSVAAVADYIGIETDGFRLVDATADMVDVEFERGLATTMATRDWVEADVRLVLARLMGDPSEIIHGALPTLAGLTGRIEDQQFFTHRLVDHRTSALMLLDAAPIDLAMIDAWGTIADGPLGVMGCNRPCEVRRFYASANPIALDATVIADLGADPAGSEALRRADEWFGTAHRLSPRTSALGPIGDFRVPQDSWWFRLITATAVPVYSNLSNDGRLFCPRFDEEAFPPIDDPGWFVRGVRKAAQRAFGLYPAPRPD